MPDETYLNVPGAKAAASNLQAAVAQFGSAIEGLKGRLARDEGCWSDDDIGKTFANKYVGPKDSTLKELGDTRTSLDSMAHDLPAVIFKAVQDQDDAYGGLMDKIDDNVIQYSQALATPGVGTSSAGVTKHAVESGPVAARTALTTRVGTVTGGGDAAATSGGSADTSLADTTASRVTQAMLGAAGGPTTPEGQAAPADATAALVARAAELGDGASQADVEAMVSGAVSGTVSGILGPQS